MDMLWGFHLELPLIDKGSKNILGRGASTSGESVILKYARDLLV